MNKALLLITLSLLPPLAIADVPADKRAEVEHLLAYVKTSSCVINRNGDDHDGKGAAKHMRKKYRHFRDDIKTSEDFIRLSATKSTMSGKMYKVRCPGKTVKTTQEWLLAELKAYRGR